MNYYGKKQQDFTEVEKTLWTKDLMYFQSFMMKMRGERLMGMGLNMGTQEDVDERIVDRTIFVGTEILGCSCPRNQKEFNVIEKQVEESKYSIIQFVKDHTSPRMIMATSIG